MGCGLDDRFERVDNGRIVWFDVDLPDSAEVRKKVYEESDRRRMIAGSVTGKDWISAVKILPAHNRCFYCRGLSLQEQL